MLGCPPALAPSSALPHPALPQPPPHPPLFEATAVWACGRSCVCVGVPLLVILLDLSPAELSLAARALSTDSRRRLNGRGFSCNPCPADCHFHLHAQAPPFTRPSLWSTDTSIYSAVSSICTTVTHFYTSVRYTGTYIFSTVTSKYRPASIHLHVLSLLHFQSFPGFHSHTFPYDSHDFHLQQLFSFVHPSLADFHDSLLFQSLPVTRQSFSLSCLPIRPWY